ncbi:MAG: DUF222 domain-containing protein [Acidimicrobiales bacterium]|nr:DUF222 domain-containing protein [Acidimicrobiales bacterium]
MGMLLLGMQPEVVEVRERFAALVARLDPDDLPASYAPGLWRELDRLGRQVAAAKTLVARRVEDSRVWQSAGHASAAEYLAAQGGTSIGAARVELETSRALPGLPVTRAALVEGSVSAQQGALVAEAAKVNPAAESDLVGAAGKESFRELKERGQRAKAAADPDPEATQRRIHRQRCLREYTDAEGAWNLHARGTKADGARVHAALAPLIEAIFTEDRREGRRETPEARAFDALVEGLTRPASGGRGGRRVRREGLIRCDLAALQRGSVVDGELCEVAGVGPVSVPQAVDLLGEATWRLLITSGVDVLNVTTLSRKASAAMLAALAWRQPTCAVAGCGRTLVEIDHRLGWAATGRTRLDELDPLCDHHHDLKTCQRWALVAGTGPRAFVAPDDPRHPDHTRHTGHTQATATSPEATLWAETTDDRGPTPVHHTSRTTGTDPPTAA